jgi:hypothetical protein
VAAARADNRAVVQALADELRNTEIESVFDAMDSAGVFAALDELPEVTFGELRKSAIPPEDRQLLASAGIENPEAEITLIINYCRARVARHYFYSNRDVHPFSSRYVREAQESLKQAAEIIQEAEPSEVAAGSKGKRRKLFNGIGKILTGAIAGAGNLLLATGTVVAPNPATAYGAIASSALAVGAIFQGIGDLRGE